MGAYASTYPHTVLSALVTGATGFIGQALCSRLGNEGVRVRPFNRTGGFLPDGTPLTAVDFAEAALDDIHVEGVSTVFHLAGIAHRYHAGQPYDAVNHRASIDLAMRAEAAGVRVFVYLSSVKAMGDAFAGSPRGEEECVLPTESYGLSKWRAEESLRETFRNSPMAVYIVRPALVYGPSARGNLRLMERMVSLGLPRPPERGGRSMVSRDDLVELMLRAARRHEPGVATWIAADGEVYSTRRVYDALRRAANKPPGRGWLPVWGWRVGAACVDAIRPGGEPMWRKLFATELYSAQRAREAAGWIAQDTLERTLGVEEPGQC